MEEIISDSTQIKDDMVSGFVNKLLSSYGEKGIYGALAKMLGYSESPPTITEFIDSKDWIGDMLGGDKMYPPIRQGLYEVYPNPFVSPYVEILLGGAIGCVVGDTRIPLLDGTNPTIKELAENNRNKWIYLYSYDIRTDDVTIGVAFNPHCSGKDVDTYEVTLDNGESIICTDNHPFLLRNKKYVRADKLNPGDSLMALYRRVTDTGKYSGYEEVLMPRKNKWVPTHKIVSSWKYGPEIKNHIDIALAVSNMIKKNKEIALSDPNFIDPHREWLRNYNRTRHIQNHKVVSVRYVGKQDVYDISVLEHNNYATSAGVFVHNTGKSSMAIVGALYDLCRLLHMKNPQEYYKLIASTKIAYAVINATVSLATDVIYDQMIQMIQSSPMFRRYRGGRGQTLFRNNINILVGSRPSHALGTAVMGAILDEVNFMDKITNQAYDNYFGIKRRIQSRFLQPGGSYPARVWLISSKRREDDFLEDHLKKSITNEDTKLFSYAIWDIQKYKLEYCGENFKVFIGDNLRDPKIIHQGISSHGMDDSRIIDVPVEYLKDFEFNITQSLQDLAGLSVRSILKYIPSKEAIGRCLVMPNPVTRDVIELDFWDKSDTIANYIDWSKVMVPQYRHAPRYIHIDIGLTGDRFAIASTFVSNVNYVQRFDNTTNTYLNVAEPSFITEFVVIIQAKSRSEIPISKAKDFLITLKNKRYPLSKVTMDGFQSVNLRQDLLLAGIRAEYLSVDRDKHAYDALKSAIVQSRWFGPNIEILEKEISGLLDIGKKIEHPAKGCFVGETLVNLYSKQDFSHLQVKFKDLNKYYCDNYFVRSYHNNTMSYNEFSNPRVTKSVDTVIELLLEDGSSFKCTLDHLILTDIGYVEAQNLSNQHNIISV